MLFELLMVIYWLATATWFGAVLFLVIAPAVILRTVRENNPILPHVLSVNLQGQHGTLLAGSIVAGLCKYIRPLEMTCMIALAITLGVQWAQGANLGSSITLPLLFRTMLFLMAGAFFIYDWRFVWPQVMRYLNTYIENADDPEVANPALDQFDRYSAEGQSMLRNTLIALLGLLVFSATTMVRPISPTTDSPTTASPTPVSAPAAEASPK